MKFLFIYCFIIKAILIQTLAMSIFSVSNVDKGEGFQLKKAEVINPFTLNITFNSKIENVLQPEVHLEDQILKSYSNPNDSTLIFYGLKPFSQEILSGKVTFKTTTSSAAYTIPFSVDNRKILVKKIQIINAKNLLLSFNHFYSASSVSQTSMYSVQHQPPAEIVLKENGFELELLLANELTPSQSYLLHFEAFKNREGQEGIKHSQWIHYRNYIEQIHVKNAQLIQLHYSLPIEITNPSYFILEEHEDTLKIAQRLLLNEIDLNNNVPLEEGIQYTLATSMLTTPKGQAIPGVRQSFVWDQTPPEVVNVYSLNAKEIVVVFSENIDLAFAFNTQNYLIEGKHPVEVKLMEKETQIRLTFDRNFLNNVEYELEVFDIPDLHSNYLEEQTFRFIFQSAQKSSYKAVVINEVMAAPKTGYVLPNVEYVELYNPNETSIELGGFSLSNSKKKTIIPNYSLAAKSYLILTLRTRTNLFESYGKVLGLTNWPTFLNAGDQVKLKDSNDQLIDSLSYSNSTYGSSSLANGAYSLEIVNPYYPCNESSNLRPSQDPKRGTPGSENSVYDKQLEKSPLNIISWSLGQDSTLVIEFSKTINEVGLFSQWVVTPDLGIQKVIQEPSGNKLRIHFLKNLQAGVQYNLRLPNIKDCGGNGLASNQKELSFVVPMTAQQGEIVINEVLFNPRSGTPKFVEIYNASSKYLNLKDWKLANINSNGEVANRKVLFNSDYAFPPFSYLVFTTDIETLKREYPKGEVLNFKEVASLPSYPISSGNVVLLNADETMQEIFTYHENMHHPMIKDPKGVSLERFSTLLAVDHPSNWHSASAYIGFASPGLKNSNAFDESNSLIFDVNPRIFAPNNPLGSNFTTIKLNLSQLGCIGSIYIFQSDGQMIKEICKNDIWGSEVIYTWDGTNAKGSFVRSGIYLVLIHYFDPSGKVEKLIKTVVIADSFLK
jgi:hypothetical protein